MTATSPVRLALRMAQAAAWLYALAWVLTAGLVAVAGAVTLALGLALFAATVAGTAPLAHGRPRLPSTFLLNDMTGLSLDNALLAIALLALANIVIVPAMRALASAIGRFAHAPE